MQYLGGKTKIARHIAAALTPYRAPGQWLWEPFCGGLGATPALRVAGPVLATDANAALIALYQAVAQGWDPPGRVSETEYAAAKALPDTDPLKAFCGFGCSFAGKYWGGYARGEAGRNYAASARRALRRDCPGGVFACVDFLAIEPHELDAVLYLDPPYAGATGYATGAFDHARLVERAWQWAQFCEVFVSEYNFPLGSVIWESAKHRALRGATTHAVECLYRVRA